MNIKELQEQAIEFAEGSHSNSIIFSERNKELRNFWKHGCRKMRSLINAEILIMFGQ